MKTLRPGQEVSGSKFPEINGNAKARPWGLLPSVLLSSCGSCPAGGLLAPPGLELFTITSSQSVSATLGV